jgi:hypothetical protein
MAWFIDEKKRQYFVLINTPFNLKAVFATTDIPEAIYRKL